MIFPSFSTSLAAVLSFGALASSARPATVNAADMVKNINDITDLSKSLDGVVGTAQNGDINILRRQAPTDALSLVTGLKDTVGGILSQVTSLGDSGNLDAAAGQDILGQLTSALTSATSAAGSLPAGSVPASEPNETSALGTQVATIVVEVLKDVVAIVARLGVVLPVLAPLLLAVDGLVVGLLTALAPVVGGLLANVSALVFSLGGSNLAGLISNLGLGLTAGLLTLAVPV